MIIAVLAKSQPIQNLFHCIMRRIGSCCKIQVN